MSAPVERPHKKRRRPGAKRVNNAVVDAALGAPWAITEDGLRLVLAVASRATLFPDAIPAALQAREGRPLDNTRTVDIRDGVARIPVTGALVRYGDWMADLSGAASYDVLALDLRAALDNPEVHAVVLDVDSPGGEVNGCGELAQFLATARPADGRDVSIVAYVSHQACSAAYWLASACDEIVAVDTAIVGSLGVCMSYIDTSAADAAMGVRAIEFISSQTPRKNIDPATDAGRADVQATVDALASVFLARVGSYRLGITDPFEVAQRLGAGGVFVGASAVAVGLADRLGTYEQLHAELVARALAPAPPPAAPRNAPSAARRGVAPSASSEGLAMPRAIARSATPPAAAVADLTPAAEQAPDPSPPSPSPAPAFGVDTPVVVAVDRAVSAMAGDRGVVAEMRTGFFYAVALDGGVGDVRWLAEDELSVPPAEQPPAADATASAAERAGRLTAVLRGRHPQAVAAIAAEAAAAERARIVAVQALGVEMGAGADAVAQAIADPACTEANAPLRFHRARAAERAGRVSTLQGDEAALQAAGAPSAVGTADGAGADDSSPEAQADRILATAALARGASRTAPRPARA
jgi:ClpP class serine protease